MGPIFYPYTSTLLLVLVSQNMNTYRIYMEPHQVEFLLRNDYYLPQHSEVLTIVFFYLNFVLTFESLCLLNNPL